jgi:hypothetical protein
MIDRGDKATHIKGNAIVLTRSSQSLYDTWAGVLNVAFRRETSALSSYFLEILTLPSQAITDHHRPTLPTLLCNGLP